MFLIWSLVKSSKDNHNYGGIKQEMMSTKFRATFDKLAVYDLKSGKIFPIPTATSLIPSAQFHPVNLLRPGTVECLLEGSVFLVSGLPYVLI